MSEVQQRTCANAAECTPQCTSSHNAAGCRVSSSLLAAPRQTLPVAKVSKSFIQSRANWWRDTSILLNVCSHTGSTAAAAAAMQWALQWQAAQRCMQHLLRTQHASAVATGGHAHTVKHLKNKALCPRPCRYSSCVLGFVCNNVRDALVC